MVLIADRSMQLFPLQISSLSGAGLPSLAANILRERQGRDVYVLGAANVGKSAFINALLSKSLFQAATE